MTKQSQEKTIKSKKENKPVTTAWDEASSSYEQSQSFIGYSHSSGENLIERQTARLGDTRMQSAQRQTLAAQIGRVQGNQHLQRVVNAPDWHKKTQGVPSLANLSTLQRTPDTSRRDVSGTIRVQWDYERSLFRRRTAQQLEDAPLNVPCSLWSTLLPSNLYTIHGELASAFSRLLPSTDPNIELNVRFHCDGSEQGSSLEFGIGQVQGFNRLEAEWEQAHPAGRVERISEDRIALWNFAVNSAALKSEHEAGIREFIRTRWPLARLSSNIVIEGHASHTGPERVNDPLSINRAETVAHSVIGDDNLPGTVTDNVYSNRVWVTSYAATRPRVPGNTFENMARNRRVEIFIERRPQPGPTPEAEPSRPGSTNFKIRGLGTISASVAILGGDFGFYEIIDIQNNLSGCFGFLAGGVTGGIQAGVSLRTSWIPFTTSRPITLQNFEGHAEHGVAGIAIGRGFALEHLYMDGPVAAGARRVTIDFSGWASGVSIGIAGTVGDLSLIDSPNPVTPDYYQ
jgi:outer membrane protein OmpA-like peptidoglycan-associated protein